MRFNLTTILPDILKAYQLPEHSIAKPVGDGLINDTYQLITPEHSCYLLQKINDKVFPHPEIIAKNITLVATFLKNHFPDYLFPVPVKMPDGNPMLYLQDVGYFRIIPFVQNSHSKNVLTSPQQAFAAAAQFGKLTRLLNDFDSNTLDYPISDFHNLNLRFNQFETAINKGNVARIAEAKIEIDLLLAHQHIVAVYNKLLQNPGFQLRVTHHDTKISNVLFNEQDQAICVIDLDTLMPGYFISDVGDMMRTYLCPLSEEATDFENITIRKPYYEAIKNGYLSEMQDILTETEKEHFHFAGQFMIYMQALRFLTDYLNNDIYYGAKYEKHNYNRAKNQIRLLQQYNNF